MLRSGRAGASAGRSECMLPWRGEECAVGGSLWSDDLVIHELTLPGMETLSVFSEPSSSWGRTAARLGSSCRHRRPLPPCEGAPSTPSPNFNVPQGVAWQRTESLMGSFVGFLVLLPKYRRHFWAQGTLGKPQGRRPGPKRNLASGVWLAWLPWGLCLRPFFSLFFFFFLTLKEKSFLFPCFTNKAG